jgi:NAD(P) transhydrogenase
MLGVFAGLLATLLAVGFTPEQTAQCAIVIAAGGALGLAIGRRVSPMQLPQTVAALHSVVGLAAVLTSAGSVLSHYDEFGAASGVVHGAGGASPEQKGDHAGVGVKEEQGKKAHGLSKLHLTTAYLGVLIGGVTFTGQLGERI